MSNVCTHCGAPLAADSRFCGQCGTPVVPDDAQQAAETRLPPAEPAHAPPPQAAPPGPDASAASGGDADTGVQPPPDLLDAKAARGFLASLFDISFSHFITSRVVTLLYVLSMIGIGVVYLVGAAALFGQSSGLGLLWLLLLGPIVALIELIWVRVLLEVAVVFFRINSTSRDILTTLQRRS